VVSCGRLRFSGVPHVTCLMCIHRVYGKIYSMCLCTAGFIQSSEYVYLPICFTLFLLSRCIGAYVYCDEHVCLYVCLSVCLSAKLSIFHQIFDARCLRPCFDPPKVKVSKRYTRTHMPCGITQCYLPPGRGDNPALTSAESGTRFSDPG